VLTTTLASDFYALLLATLNRVNGIEELTAISKGFKDWETIPGDIRAVLNILVLFQQENYTELDNLIGENDFLAIGDLLVDEPISFSIYIKALLKVGVLKYAEPLLAKLTFFHPEEAVNIEPLFEETSLAKVGKLKQELADKYAQTLFEGLHRTSVLWPTNESKKEGFILFVSSLTPSSIVLLQSIAALNSPALKSHLRIVEVFLDEDNDTLEPYRKSLKELWLTLEDPKLMRQSELYRLPSLAVIDLAGQIADFSRPVALDAVLLERDVTLLMPLLSKKSRPEGVKASK
jgi:hypothetical protein